MTAVAPDMTDLYRQLLGQLTTKFGGEVDDHNAEAIAFAAAELYHRDYEPRLWQEKSAHELLDMLGVPRAGVFAPHSLSERVLALQRRTSQAAYVAKAHELLTTLGVPRQDEGGVDRPVRWRLEQLLAGAPEAVAPDPDDADPIDGADDGGENEAPAAQLIEQPESEADAAAEVERAEAGAPAEVERAELDVDDEAVDGEPGDADAAAEVERAELDVDDAAGAAPLADAVRALEKAARLEAALTEIGPAPDVPMDIDLVRVNESLNGIFAELADLRAMVESLGTDLRTRLELVHEEVLVATGVLRPDRNVVAAETTADVPVVEPFLAPTAESEPEPGNGVARRSLRRVMLLVLLLILGLALAGAIILIGIYGWEQVRSEVSGFLS